MVTKGHVYLSKPVGKSSKSTKSEVFLQEFFNKFEDIANYETINLVALDLRH